MAKARSRAQPATFYDFLRKQSGKPFWSVGEKRRNDKSFNHFADGIRADCIKRLQEAK